MRLLRNLFLLVIILFLSLSVMLFSSFKEISNNGYTDIPDSFSIEKYTFQYSSHLYSESKFSALKITEVKPSYDENSKIVDGREIINSCFHSIFSNNKLVFSVGEDVGLIGGVKVSANTEPI